MTKSFGCSDVGVNCNWTTNADSEEDLMKKIKEHANTVHGFKEMPQDLADKVKLAIKEK